MEDFLREAACMKEFDHPNVMRLLGEFILPTHHIKDQLIDVTKIHVFSLTLYSWVSLPRFSDKHSAGESI